MFFGRSWPVCSLEESERAKGNICVAYPAANTSCLPASDVLLVDVLYHC